MPDAATLVQIVIAAIGLEFVALALLFRRTGRGLPPGQLALKLLPGLCLLLALRAGVVGAGNFEIAAWLTGAGVLHGIDLRRSWLRNGDSLH
jgi:hypothetical protein